ncbi:peptidase s41 family protein [Moniliophthora roreri MCA 2997]|uniref:Peptidase s41 family protein n=1 Tax=Moniliophthora roreri (strain MCA 2997) TaxID=1381753 RepID=V2XFU1_MONRO|nr:peptidase s41 family protein [Moniliophthora roreri MCA 2997]
MRSHSSLFLALSIWQYGVHAAPSAADPCAKIAGKNFVPPADALACEKSFPFNETLRQNILTNVARVFDFYTFENYYLDSPPPFQESTIDIRAMIEKLNTTAYKTDYDFNKDLFDFTNQLNDGHTRWLPDCIGFFQNILPTPVVTLEVDGVQGVYIAPDAVEFISLLGSEYTGFFDSIGFDWKRLAGAKVTSIEDQDPYDYVDFIARTVSGNYLDHGVRVNSVFSSYRISANTYSQRLGDLAGPSGVQRTSLKFKLIPVNSTQEETVTVPYLASFLGNQFTDKDSFWANNCAANEFTNGVDLRTQSTFLPRKRLQPIASIIDTAHSVNINLPGPFIPNLPQLPGSDGVIKNYVLPDGKTGVMFVGSFSPSGNTGFDQFQADVVSAINAFKGAGVSRLLIDLTNNGGGFVCLGQFLFQYLAGAKIGYPGFESTSRGNELAQEIVSANIALGLDQTLTFYAPDNWAFLNGTVFPPTFDYNNPTAPFTINGRSDPTSQRFHDTCEFAFSQKVPQEPPFDASNIAIVSNGNCASTCAMFSTLMNERLQTKIGVFGGRPGQGIEFKGMAGNQVLEWADLDTEIKTAGLKDDPLAPPDLLVSANFRHNWRTAWSFLDEETPIAYLSEPPKFRFAYTQDTYNNPQNLWIFAAAQMLP